MCRPVQCAGQISQLVGSGCRQAAIVVASGHSFSNGRHRRYRLDKVSRQTQTQECSGQHRQGSPQYDKGPETGQPLFDVGQGPGGPGVAQQSAVVFNGQGQIHDGSAEPMVVPGRDARAVGANVHDLGSAGKVVQRGRVLLGICQHEAMYIDYG